MQSHTFFNESLVSSDRIKPTINGAQKNIIQGVFKFYLDDIAELGNNLTIQVLRDLFLGSHSQEKISNYKRVGILDTINEIRSYTTHPCPQNRSTSCYDQADFIHPHGHVAYKNSEGRVMYEQKGLLSLTARNDDTAIPITKKATIEYIQNLVTAALEKHRLLHNRNTRKLDDDGMSCVSSGSFIQRNKWVVCIATNNYSNQTSIYLEGMRTSGGIFLDRYELHIDNNGQSISAESLDFQEFDVDQSSCLRFSIDDVKGNRLKKEIRKEAMSFSGFSGKSFLKTSSIARNQNEERSLEWAINKLKKINIEVDTTLLIAKRPRSSCSIM
jgi:hypothetical protein